MRIYGQRFGELTTACCSWTNDQRDYFEQPSEVGLRASLQTANRPGPRCRVESGESIPTHLSMANEKGLPNAIDTDNYANSSPISATQTLHPNDARDGRDGRYIDRKGKGSTVPRKPVPLDVAGRPSEDESATSGAMDRKVSMSSNGSVTGDDDGYVAVNLEDRRASR